MSVKTNIAVKYFEIGRSELNWNCRAINDIMTAWYLDTRGFILKTIQWHMHTGLRSLVNCLAGSLYEALYKVLMNIN